MFLHVNGDVRSKCVMYLIVVDKGVAIKDDEKLPNDDFGNNMEIHSQLMGSSSPMLKGTFCTGGIGEGKT